MTASLPALEQHLVACLIELDDLRSSRPRLSTAIVRAEAGRLIDELYEQIVELRDQIEASPAVTLQDAAVKLRRLSAYLEEESPVRLLEGALTAVERAASQPSGG